ncbi:MAG: hypothetical protein MJZ08_05850 [Bacteroidaceae bacterium]|nr:hypothetical protein [Bacteroidaceae bacterium]
MLYKNEPYTRRSSTLASLSPSAATESHRRLRRFYKAQRLKVIDACVAFTKRSD